MTLKRKIFKIEKIRTVDCGPDISYLGEYTDELKEGVIVRRDNEFYEKLPCEMERDENGKFCGKGDFLNPLPERGREFRGFKPAAGGEKIGTPEYYKYGMQDYERMAGLERGDWCYFGVSAQAQVGVSLNGGKSFNVETIRSAGLWGIESDSEQSYFDEVMGEELAELKGLLEAYGFGRSVVAKAIKAAEWKDA